MEKTRSVLLRKKNILGIIGLFIILIYINEFVGTGPGKSHWDMISTITKHVKTTCKGYNSTLNQRKLTESPFLVNTEFCKILNMDPFHPSVCKYLKPGKQMKCKQPIVQIQNEALKINKDVLKKWKNTGSACCYKVVSRVTQSSKHYDRNADWGVAISDECHPITNGSQLTHPYVRIECSNLLKLKVEKHQYEAVVLPPLNLSHATAAKVSIWDQLRQDSKKAAFTPPPNILVIGVDSISRLHMIRQLPETISYLDGNDFIEMKGYTKVGENTFPNMMAAMAGMPGYPYGCWSKREDKIDDCPFIWKNFSQNGYLTAFAEDSPGIAIFNYQKTGFVVQPTDYYLRPLMAASHLERGISRDSGDVSCFGGISPTSYLMKYIRQILNHTGNRYPLFLLSWFTSIGHDDFNGLKTADITFRDFLKDLVQNPKYGSNNTLILFISDHGYRFGGFRETFLGFYEESLPFFFVRMPPTLKEKFPVWYKRLKENSERLTTPLDLYETVRDLLRLSAINNTESSAFVETELILDDDNTTQLTKGTFDLIRDPNFRQSYSFFERTPTNRTCESSGIPERYCMCGVTPDVDKKSDFTIQLAKFVVKELNRVQLKSVIEKNQCHVLKFSSVLYGRLFSSSEHQNVVNETYKDYIVAFEVNPGKGHFEAHLRQFSNSTNTIRGDVSRINSYKGQSECMDNYLLRNYCMCTHLVKTKG